MENHRGARLKEERERLGLSQTAMGAIGGVKKLAQLKYEQSDSSPGWDYFEAIARLGADVLYIITGSRTGTALSSDEQELLVLYRASSLTAKLAAVGALQGAAMAAEVSASPKTLSAERFGASKISIGGNVTGQVVEGGLVNNGPVTFGGKKKN